MTLEQSLVAQKITSMQKQGYSTETSIQASIKLLKSQGFGAVHAESVSRNMADLLF